MCVGKRERAKECINVFESKEIAGCVGCFTPKDWKSLQTIYESKKKDSPYVAFFLYLLDSLT